MDLDRLEIHPASVLPLLFGKTDETPFVIARWIVMSTFQYWNDKRMSEDMRALIMCEEVDIAIIDNLESSWCLSGVHCISPVHGMHPRYKDLYARLYAKMAPPQKEPCDRCDGSGWLKAEEEDANRVIVMSSVVKMFRGIRLAEDGYKPEDIDKGPMFEGVMNFLKSARMEDFTTRKEAADGSEEKS